VVGKNLEKNQLIVGWDDHQSAGLYATECTVGTLSKLHEGFEQRRTVEAQPRYRAKAEPASLEPLADGKIRLKFHRPQRAIVAGQICAFYEGGQMLGGGVFESVGI
jgi:tRNA-uridine 2-sulfurtransferase